MLPHATPNHTLTAYHPSSRVLLMWSSAPGQLWVTVICVAKLLLFSADNTLAPSHCGLSVLFVFGIRRSQWVVNWCSAFVLHRTLFILSALNCPLATFLTLPKELKSSAGYWVSTACPQTIAMSHADCNLGMSVKLVVYFVVYVISASFFQFRLFYFNADSYFRFLI